MYRCDLTNRRLAHPSEASILAVSVSVAGSPQHQLGNLRLISLHPEQVRQDAIPEGGHLESKHLRKIQRVIHNWPPYFPQTIAASKIHVPSIDPFSCERGEPNWNPVRMTT
jgi:hypothetical protein